MSEFHVDVGAYALDALDDTERAAFEEHLAGCEQCRRELAEFSETAARLGVLAEAPAPVELRGAVLDAIHQVRPLPPVEPPSPPAPQADDVAPTTASGGRGPRRAMEQPAWDLAPAPDDDSPAPTDELARRRLHRRSRLLTLAVAAATVITLALGGWTFALHRQQQVAAAQQAATTRLLSAPDVRTYPVTVEGAPATFVVSKSLNEAAFVGADVPSAPAGRTYQAWPLDSDQNPTPDETFAGGPDTRTFMSGDIRDAAYLAVTNEPKGGSTLPTPPVLAVATL